MVNMLLGILVAFVGFMIMPPSQCNQWAIVVCLRWAVGTVVFLMGLIIFLGMLPALR